MAGRGRHDVQIEILDVQRLAVVRLLAVTKTDQRRTLLRLHFRSCVVFLDPVRLRARQRLSLNGAAIRLLYSRRCAGGFLVRGRANPSQVKTLMAPMTRTTSGKSLEPLAVSAVVEASERVGSDASAGHCGRHRLLRSRTPNSVAIGKHLVLH